MAIHIDVLATIREQQVQREAEKLADIMSESGHESGKSWTSGFSDELIKSAPSIQRALGGVETAAERVFEQQVRLNDARKRGVDGDHLVILENNVSRALRDQANAYLTVSAAAQSHYNKIERDSERAAAARMKQSRDWLKQMDDEAKAAKKASDAAGDWIDDIQKIGQEAFRTGRGLGSMGLGPLIIALYQTAEVAVTASQSIALLPAVAVAAGAGIGTLALATQGFGQAMKDMGDPKKFAADLAQLSPEAQQAVLSIKSLIPAFDQLKLSTQDAFFAGFGQEIQNLTNTYLPSVQTLTTGIATSFNQMITTTANSLMTPENQATIKQMMADISSGFENAVPAVQKFSQAFIDIASVGSSFLPDLGSSISTVASQFADFISEARDSGKLKEWIQQGIDAAKEIGGAIKDIGVFIYDVFGGASKETVENWRRSLQDVLIVMEAMAGSPLGQTMHALTGETDSFNASLTTLISPLTIFVDLINKIRWYLDPNFRNKSPDAGGAARGTKSGGFDLPDIPGTAGIPGVSGSGGSTGSGLIDPSTGKPFPLPPGTVVPGQGGSVLGRAGVFGLTPADGRSGWGGGAGVFAPANAPNPKRPSDKDRRDAIIAGLDPSQYRVDPFAPVPGLPAVQGIGPIGPNMYSAPGYQQDPQGVLEKETALEGRAHDLEEARKDRLALEQDNTASAEQINDARWKEHEKEQQLQKAQADLAEKMLGTAKDTKKGMDQLGAAIDPDFGLSKGLAGFAENLTKMFGNILLGPTLTQLQATANASPLQGGFGLMGILGAQNISEGKSPILGNPLTPEQQAAYYSNGGKPNSGTYTAAPGWTPPNAVASAAGSYGLPGGTDTGGYGTGTSATFPPWAIALGQAFGVTPSTYSGHQETDRNEPGYAPNPGHENRGIDWSGTPQNMQRFADYLKTVAPSLEQVIWNGAGIGTGDTVEIAGGRPQPGYFAGDLAGHGNHVHTRQSMPIPLPGGVMPDGTVSSAQYSASATAPALSAGGTTPVFVTNWPGGGMGMPGAAPGGAPAGVATNGATPGAADGRNWDALAQLEAGGNWNNTKNPKYRGGLQFDIPTWNQFKPADAPADPATATKEMQIAAAQNAISSGRTPESLWPTNYAALGTPGAAPAGGGWQQGMPTGPGPLPAGITGGAGESPIFGAGTQGGPGPGMGVGTDLGTPFGLGGYPGIGAGAAGPTQIGAVVGPPTGTGAGGVGITPGGTLDTAVNLAASAFPGVGQAAATGVKLGSRAIQYAGQLAGIGVEGLMQTFLPSGGSELANNSWFSRILGGVAGALPAIPNIAGGQGAKNGQPPLTPEQTAAQQGLGPGMQQGVTNNINLPENRETGDAQGRDIAAHLTAQYSTPGRN